MLKVAVIMHHRFDIRRTGPLLMTIAIVLAACGPAGSGQGQARAKRAAEDLSAAFARIATDELERSPETASRLGLSEQQAGYAFKSRLDDRSQAIFERMRLLRLENLETLEAVDASGLPNDRKAQYGIVLDAYRNAVDMAAFGHGHVALGYARPYAADHLNGAYLDIPELLMRDSLLRDRVDAEGFLSRLKALAPTLDDERRRLAADSRAGITPPDFILARMLQIAAVMLGPSLPEPHPLYLAYEEQLADVDDGVSADSRANLLAEAAAIISEEVQPAYARYVGTLEELAAKAPSAPGIWQLPNGEAYYQASLDLYAGAGQSPESIGQIGEQLVQSLSGELDARLANLGHVKGPVGERLSLLSQSEGQTYPGDEAGRAALLLRLESHLARAADRLGDIVPAEPRQAVTVEAVPQMFEAGHPGGYYQSAPLNGGTPARFFINLRESGEWPDFSLATLAFHEGIPGHHLESTHQGETQDFPLVRRLVWLPAYGEGWAVYAEDIALELGLYDEDPLGEIGYLQSLLFRAARLVADAGIHDGRWTREDAVAYLASTTGLPLSAIEAEVDRYAVWPGQAAAYMLGRLEILRLRQRAEDILGERFSRAAFHDVLLASGPRPFPFVEKDIDNWISEELAD